MKKIAIAVSLLALAGFSFAQATPTLKIDYQVNAVAADDANNYLTFTGPVSSSNKDGFDAVTGASKHESTFTFNYYRNDIFGKKILPGGLRGMFLYPIAGDKTRTDDALNVTKLSDGSIRVRYIHRGTANEVTTDTSGKLVFPGAKFMARKVGYIVGEGPQVIASDFYVDDMTAKVDWNKVWDRNIKGGKVIGATTQKTGDIVVDVANSEILGYEGTLQFTFDGKILKVVGELKIVKK